MPYGTRECALWDEGEPYSRGECSYPQAGKKGQRLFGNDPTVFPNVCARFVLARLNFDSESSASHDEMRLLDLFATQSNKSNNIIYQSCCLLSFLPCLDSSCLHRMVKSTRILKAKT